MALLRVRKAAGAGSRWAAIGGRGRGAPGRLCSAAQADAPMEAVEARRHGEWQAILHLVVAGRPHRQSGCRQQLGRRRKQPLRPATLRTQVERDREAQPRSRRRDLATKGWTAPPRGNTGLPYCPPRAPRRGSARLQSPRARPRHPNRHPFRNARVRVTVPLLARVLAI